MNDEANYCEFIGLTRLVIRLLSTVTQLIVTSSCTLTNLILRIS